MTRPRRILLLNERDPEHPRAGGAEIHVARLCSRLVARGHSVTQYSTRFAGAARRASIEGVSIERRGPLPLYYASVPGRVREAARSGTVDLVIECLNKLPFYSPLFTGTRPAGAAAPSRGRLPVLAICHHLFGGVAFQQASFPIAAGVVLAEAGLARAYRDVPFLAISESTRQDLIERGIAAEQIFVSPPGIDPPAFVADPDTRPLPRATYVGRLERYKRVDLLLRAGALLVERVPGLELLVIGQGPDRRRLERLARKLGLEGCTRFTGFVSDRERDALLAGSRVSVFPSEKEGWGLTVIEANALATPVVARDAPGLRDSIQHGRTGLLVASGESKDVRDDADPRSEAGRYAEAMAVLLTNEEAARTMRHACLAWSKRFDWERAASDLEDAIERTLGVDPE